MSVAHGPATAQPVARLINELARLPGIGPKTASRLAYHLLRASRDEAISLAEAILDVKERVRLCSVCFNTTEADPCAICLDSSRDRTICVVEEPLDVLALERTGQFKGRYHVLHGAVSPVEGIGPDQLKIRELVERVERDRPEEVIVATNLDLPWRSHSGVFASPVGAPGRDGFAASERASRGGRSGVCGRGDAWPSARWPPRALSRQVAA